MIDPTRNTYSPPDVSPPGDTLRELLEERGLSQADLAERMGRPKKTISEIVNPRPRSHQRPRSNSSWCLA